jgi:hypothetical protein
VSNRAACWWSVLALLFAGATALAARADQEVIPPTEASDIRTIVKTVEGAIRGAYSSGVRPAIRDAHAKGHGCVKAEFVVEKNIPSKLRKGVFAAPRTYPAWIRFSNGSGTPDDDHAGDGRGMAIKLMGVDGEKILADEADAKTQDFVMINYPVFFVRNVADYMTFTGLSVAGKSDQFYASHPREKGIVDAIKSRSVGDVFDERYFSMSAYMLGDQYIKFAARPVNCASGQALAESTTAGPNGNPTYLRDGMVTWLNQKDACFKFAVQPQTAAALQPVEDPTVVWDEAKAPFFHVATIRIPKQAFNSEAQQTFCENLSFTPWHSLPENRPVGGINRLRKVIYEAISKLRHDLNKAPRQEPTGEESFN